ncbi:MAG: hypothetical protein HKN56_01460 [Gammaproteobacteria bacterium]|nr:hypothetical protein [Gammaproteobacteria bacterium]NND53621.1 hypothetical protein [Gammaproteobacteria bacterium]
MADAARIAITPVIAIKQAVRVQNMRHLALFLCLAGSISIAGAQTTYSVYGDSGAPERVKRLDMFVFGSEVFLQIYTPDDRDFRFNIASTGDPTVQCDLDGDERSQTALLPLQDNSLFDYFFSMLLSAVTSGAKVVLYYDGCFAGFGASWPLVTRVALQSQITD